MAAKNLSHISIIFVATFSVQGTLAADSTSTVRAAIAEYGRSQSFEPNRGQTNKQVDFLAHGTGYSLFLSRGEAVMVLHRNAPGQLRLRHAHTLMNSAAVRMRPVGGNASAAVEGLGELPGKSNYLLGNYGELRQRKSWLPGPISNIQPGRLQPSDKPLIFNATSHRRLHSRHAKARLANTKVMFLCRG